MSGAGPFFPNEAHGQVMDEALRDLNNNAPCLGGQSSTVRPSSPRLGRVSFSSEPMEDESAEEDDEDESSAASDGQPLPECDEERLESIRLLAEAYLSDDFLRKNSFLVKHILRNRKGYVSLKLLASFKKLKSLAGDYRLLAYALKESRFLALNDKASKVRRRLPLPEELAYDSKLDIHVAVHSIPHQDFTVNYITDAFHEYSKDIVSVVIVRYGKEIPNKYQSHFDIHAYLKEQVVAVVEFSSSEITNLALGTIWADTKYEGMLAELLHLKEAIRRQQKFKASPLGDVSRVRSGSYSGPIGKPTKLEQRVRAMTISCNEPYPSSSTDDVGGLNSFSSCHRRFQRRQLDVEVFQDRRRVQPPPPLRRCDSAPNSALQLGFRRPRAETAREYRVSPLVANSSSSSGMFGGWRDSVEVMRDDLAGSFVASRAVIYPSVVRQPHGPDGTSGFRAHPFLARSTSVIGK